MLIMNNIKVNNYKNALVEVDAVLDCLQYEEYIKIPPNIINAIKLNKNDEYIFEYDEELDYENWNLMSEAKAILYNLFKKYLATDEQKQYFKQKEQLEIMKLERAKEKKYNTYELFKMKEENISKENKNLKSLIEVKEKKWYKKIFNFIKKYLRKIK